ncbi:MAG: L-threonylcarbamoyladenylate synthase [Terriglobales bacterium]
MPRRIPIPTHAGGEQLASAVIELRAHLDAGQVAVVPTDTLYGLAAKATDAEAVARVYALKGRSFDKPLPVVVRDRRQAAELAARLPPNFEALTAAFWPGPLTLIVPAAAHLPPALTAGTGALAMRQPDQPLLAALLLATGYALTATSANRSGAPACRTVEEVEAQFGADCPLLVDAGPSPSTLPSTIVDLGGPQPRIVRAGAIAAGRLAPFGVL